MQRGGDGCVLNEVCKHSYLRDIDICDIDNMVIDLSKKHFSWNQGWNDKRVTVYNQDASKYIKETNKKYSIVIMDSSDPFDGMVAEALYTDDFFNDIYNILDDDGIFCFQSECIFVSKELIKKWRNFLLKKFKYVYYGNINVPTYPCGQIGMMLCSKKYDPRKINNINNVDISKLEYYNKDIHNSSFILPNFYKLN